jgi:uncharacterized protein
MDQDSPPAENVILAEVLEPAEPIQPQPWGFWATLALCLAVMTAFVAVQSVVVVGFIVAESIGNPCAGADEIRAIGNNGLCLSVSTWLSAPLCLALVALLVSVRRQWSIRDYLALNRVSAKCLMQWTVLLLAFVGVTDGLTWLVGRDIVPRIMVEAYRTAGSVALLWATLVVAAPVFEEAFFRGFMFRGIQQSRLGSPGAVIITALAWSMIHVQYDAYQLSVIFAVGVLLGIARVRSNSTVLTIVLHSLGNAIAAIELELYVWLHAGY